ncbi:MAG: putative phage protein (TIGR02216 family) [Paracoccaceae bacterium]|jgi:uncharacterized phage protein (TIGR02216 family)
MKPGRIDWPGLMRVGLGALRLTPEAFWSMTPREFEAACTVLGFGAEDGREAMSRSRLDALRARYPDAPVERKRDG